ncbi:uncharacterized protein VTP21DRAFT_10516 [Calcarisporiella thermophila]|uniref:uncharacterized protein n=1 Tax=Calcarisporiella thermophila TaxID=911321 RepID=UPI00374262D3
MWDYLFPCRGSLTEAPLSWQLTLVSGKPSPNIRRLEVLAITLASTLFITRYKKGTPSSLVFLNNWLGKETKYPPWKTFLGTITALYVLKHTFLLVGLNGPEPMARRYSKSFYRATWLMTAMDAGFWSAMNVRPRFLRDFLSIVLTLFYAVFSEEAEAKAQYYRSNITAKHIRVSWEKSLNPYLRLFIRLLAHERLSIDARKIMIPPPQVEPRMRHSVESYLYFHPPESRLQEKEEILLHIPGGGFVAMPPKCHSDYLSIWAKQLGVPIVSINYGKAPEYPYPWGCEECFDVYRTICETRGRCIGLKGEKMPKIVIVGDSAGGNLVATTIIRILEFRKTHPELPRPNAIVLIYPALELELKCWMDRKAMSLMRAQSNKSMVNLFQAKDHFRHKSPLSVVPDVKPYHRKSRLAPEDLTMSRISKDDDSSDEAIEDVVRSGGQGMSTEGIAHWDGATVSSEITLDTRLAMTSKMCYFDDRILYASLVRALTILYVGPNTPSDIFGDYHFAPLHAPLELLQEFPRTFIFCGEMDPLVDDSVIFAGRIREAKGIGLWDDERAVKLEILRGASHGFLQMLLMMPECKSIIIKLGKWIREGFDTPSMEEGEITETTSSSISVEPEAETDWQKLGDSTLGVTEKDMFNRRKESILTSLRH